MERKSGCWSLSCVRPLGRVEIGALADFDVRNVSAAHRRDIASVLRPGDFSIGGLDVSLNVEPDGQSYWQVHSHAVFGSDWDGPRKKPRNLRRGDGVRPLRLTKIADPSVVPEVLSYSMKSVFFRRSRYHYTRASGRKTTNTRSLPIPAKHEVELLVFLDAISIFDRLLLTGLRRTGSEFDFRLRPMRAKRNERMQGSSP
ncbi:MAG: hypothetical protein KDK08_19110 [Rhizobiaceae bacterium]|nr:hypothetical protein [Rhizobiaceae bacterium]